MHLKKRLSPRDNMYLFKIFDDLGFCLFLYKLFRFSTFYLFVNKLVIHC